MAVVRKRVVIPQGIYERIKKMDPDDFNNPKNVAKARREVGIDKFIGKTKRITLKVLLDNAEKLFGSGRSQDRKVNSFDYVASPGVNTFAVKSTTSTSKGSKGAGKKVPSLYKTNIVFWDVEFVNEKDRKHPLPFDLSVVGERKTFWMELLSKTKHPVMLSCTCADFQHRAMFQAASKGILFPSVKPIPYKRVKPPSGRPKVNPKNLVNLCKHIYVLLLELQSRGFISSSTTFFKNPFRRKYLTSFINLVLF